MAESRNLVYQLGCRDHYIRWVELLGQSYRDCHTSRNINSNMYSSKIRRNRTLLYILRKLYVLCYSVFGFSFKISFKGYSEQMSYTNGCIATCKCVRSELSLYSHTCSPLQLFRAYIISLLPSSRHQCSLVFQSDGALSSHEVL